MQDIIYMISVKAESDGTLTDIRALRLKDSTKLPIPISSVEYSDGNLYWIGDNKKTIYVADFTSASDEIKKITIDNNILGDDLFVRNDGKIIYTGNVTGNTSGTYMYDPDKKTSILISENEMDVHQIYNITAL